MAFAGSRAGRAGPIGLVPAAHACARPRSAGLDALRGLGTPLEAPAQLAAATGGDGARGALVAQLEPLLVGVVEQVLALLALFGGAQEEPAEQPEREEG